MNIIAKMVTWLKKSEPKCTNRHFIDVGFRPRDTMTWIFDAPKKSAHFQLGKNIVESLYVLWQYSSGILSQEEFSQRFVETIQRNFDGTVLFDIRSDACVQLSVFPKNRMPYVIILQRQADEPWEFLCVGIQESEMLPALFLRLNLQSRYSHVV